MNDEIFLPDFDLGMFRYMVARFVKLLIRARWKSNPRFLTAAELSRWELLDIYNDRLPEWQLSAMAGDAQAVLNHDYIPFCGSGGIRETDESTPIGRLIQNVVGLLQYVPALDVVDRGGPYHHSTLVAVTALLKQDRPVNWDAIIRWDLLNVIRDDLDLLPHPIRPGTEQRLSKSLSPADRDADNVFHPVAGDWNVRYRGSELFAVNNTAGTVYIHYLLQHAGLDVAATDLASAWDRSQQGPGCRVDVAAEEVNASQTHNAGPALDTVALKQCQEQYESISKELEKAQKHNDLATIERLKAERRKLADSVRKDTRPGGLPVLVGDQQRKLVDRVTKAIRRTIDNLTAKNSALGLHLDSFITTGAECKYAPDLPIAWDT